MKKIITLFVLTCSTLSITAQKKIDALEILKDIKNGKDITIKNAVINGVLDFTYMQDAKREIPLKKKSWWNFSTNYSNEIKKRIEVAIIFEDCVFKDHVLAYIPDEESEYTFTASFYNKVVFKNCQFKEKAMFKYSDFDKETNFYGTVFNEDSTFKYAKFNDTSNFKRVKFYELATFKYSEFDEFVSFEGAVFEDSATFKYTKFLNGVSFKNVRFEEDLIIKYTEITGDFDITNMKVAYEIDDKYTKINGKSFSKYILEKK